MPEAGFMRADLYRSGPRVNASRWCDECQRPGLRGWTPTALGSTLILSYYKGKFHFHALSKCKTYADALCSMSWVAAPHLLWQGERIWAGLGRGRQPGAPYYTRTI